MNRIPLCLAALLTALAFPLAGESLWEPDFSGYLSEDPALRQGSTLRVLLISPLTMEYEASRITDEKVVIQLAGGDVAGLFDFLPEAATGDQQSAESSSTGELKGALTVTVTEVVEGDYRVRGSRRMTIDGLSEEIEIEGIVPSHSVSPEGLVAFDELRDARLTLSSFLHNRNALLSIEDMQALQDGSLSPEKREFLLQNYLNRFLDVVFPP